MEEKVTTENLMVEEEEIAEEDTWTAMVEDTVEKTC